MQNAYLALTILDLFITIIEKGSPFGARRRKYCRATIFFMARFLYNAFLYCWMVYAFFAYGLKRQDVRLFLRG